MNLGLRRSDVTVQELDRETMVYDPVTREFHLLNDIAAFAFAHADGRATADDLLALAPVTLGRSVTMIEIEAAIAELDRVELLDRRADTPAAKVSRRGAMLRLSAAALALPFITTMLAPSTAMAMSNGGPKHPPKDPPKDEDKDKKDKEEKDKEDKDKKDKEEKDKYDKEQKDKEDKDKYDKELKDKEDKDKYDKEEADKKAKEEADKKAKEEQDKKDKEEADKKAKEEADKKAKEEADKKAKEEAAKKAKEEADKKAQEEADKKAKEEAAKKVASKNSGSKKRNGR